MELKDAMPRILLIAPRISGVGGIAQHVRQLAKRLKELGWEVHLLSSETMRLSMRKGVANIEYAFASTAKCLWRNYDIAHGHNLPSILALKAVRAKAKILTLHGIYSRQISLLHGKAIGLAAKIAEKTTLRWVDKVTAVSKLAASYYRRLGIEVEYIPNAIDFSELPTERKRIRTPQVTYLGRLSREKGVDLLIEAALMGLKGVVIAGDGPLRSLIEKAAQKNLIHYLGPLPRSEALKILAGSDVAVLPSRAEGVSTALLEAMALRIPIVATKVGGNLEVIRDGVDGILVEPKAEEIYEAVKFLLENRKNAEKLSEKAYQRVLTQYNWERTFSQYLTLYHSFISKSGH